MPKRKRYSAKFKVQVALEALKEQRTLAELSSHFGVHVNQISSWKKQLLEGSLEAFSQGKKTSEKDWAKEKETLFAQIGKLQMGLEAIYPKPNLSKRHEGHEIYPYLLEGVVASQINQVWSCDITYIPMNQGFMYCFALIDWYSRYVLNWEISNSSDGLFYRQGLEKALEIYGKPQIFNTDQGSQFTSKKFTKILKEAGIQISMDGKGRA